MTQQGRPPDVAGIQEEIIREISRVHLESYGEGVREVSVSLHTEFVSVLMEVDLNRAERTLVESNHSDIVKSTRESYQFVIEPTFVAIIERATGRKVRGFASRTVIDDDPWSVEVFRLS